MAAYIQQACKEFQSTLLMRGATPPACAANPHQHISIHAPHARSDVQDRHRQILFRISIHAPHARSDLLMSARSSLCSSIFQSTLLMRGATWSRTIV